MAIQFFQVPENIQEVAREVYSKYPQLQDKEIVVKQKKLGKSTMRAFPKVSWKGLRPKIIYCLEISPYVRESKEQMVKDLDRKILKGWLAHEFGHLQDYVDRSFFEMIIFGIRYVFSSNFASIVEHRADEIAVEHGFYESLKDTKIYLFRRDVSQSKYSKKLNKLYMSLEDLEICNQNWMSSRKIN